MLAKDFKVGDLVWAKMKRSPFWPAKVSDPPQTKTPKKAQHYVYFFGSKNYAWIIDEFIVPHDEDMITKASKKKVSSTLQSAIDEIRSESKSCAKKEENTEESATNDPYEFSATSELLNEEDVKLSNGSPKEVQRNTKQVSPNRKRILSLNSESPKFDSKRFKLNVLHPKKKKLKLSPNDRGAYSSCSKDGVASIIDHVKPTSQRIGFLGLGLIGRGIVKNLLKSRHHVTVWNRTPEKCNPLIKSGALKAETPASLIKSSDIIFSCVSDPSAAKSVVFGIFGVLKGLEESLAGTKGYVELTSIDYETSQEIAEAITLKGGKYLEAPLNGSRTIADKGELLVIASGDKSLFDACETCFHAFTRDAFYLSCNVGLGSKLNLILSTFMGTTYAALAEAVALAERLQVPGDKLMSVLESKGFASTELLKKGRAIVKKEFNTDICLKHLQKDMNLTLHMSNDYDQPMPVTSAANELYKHARLLGYSEHDASAVYQGARY